MPFHMWMTVFYVVLGLVVTSSVQVAPAATSPPL